METKPPKLRRSKRTSHKIIKDDWFYIDSDFSDDESISSDTKSLHDETAKDELTGKGYVSYVEGVKFVEFETLEDMQLYDRVARKNGNSSCASFNEMDLPFRGFSEVECEQSKTYMTQFKVLLKVDVNQDYQKASKSKLSRPKCGVRFKGSIVCELDGKESSVSSCAFVKSDYFKSNSVISLSTPSVSPNSSYNSVTVSPTEFENSEFDKNVEEDLLLTPQGSPALSEQDPLSSNSGVRTSIDLSAIPYVFKCYESNDCLSSKACAEVSSRFTLCIQVTPGKGRALSKSIIKYLNLRQDSNVVDRVSATIAASAVESSANTIFLPLSKDLISSAFLNSMFINYFESPISPPHTKDVSLIGSPKNSNESKTPFESSNLGKTECDENDVAAQESLCSLPHTKDVLLIGSPNNSNQQIDVEAQETWCGGDKSSISSSSSTKNSGDSSDSTNRIKQKKRKLSGSSPDLQMKKRLDASSNSNGQQFLEINFPHSLESIDPFSLKNQDIDDTSSLRIEKPSLMPHPRKEVSSSGCPIHSTKATSSRARSLDKLYPRIVSTSSLSGFSSPNIEAILPNSKKHGSSSCCPIHPNGKKPVISSGVIDLTSENDTVLHKANTEHNHAGAKKRKGLHCSSDQLPDKVIVIDDEDHGTDNQLELDKRIPCIESGSRLEPIYESSEVSSHPSVKVNCSLDSNPKVIDLTECSGINDSQKRSGSAKLPASKEKVIDLTEGNEVQSPIDVAAISTSFQSNVVSKKDDASDVVSKKDDSNYNFGISKLDQVREEVIENYSVVPLPGLQELAVMCTNVPSLGFIRVIRCSSGELMLNETFTARVYKQFDDLKALNKYLNLRFEKMTGVKEMSPLEWILATAGVIKLKKVRPINPKVWFHPSDFQLTDTGPVCFRSVAPLNHSKNSPRKHQSYMSTPLTIIKDGVNNTSTSRRIAEEGLLVSIETEEQYTSDTSKKQNDSKSEAGLSCAFKPVQITPAENENTFLSSSKNVSLQSYKVPMIEQRITATTNRSVNRIIYDKPRTAQLVSVLFNKKHGHQHGISSKNVLTNTYDVRSTNNRLSSLSTNGLPHGGKLSTVNVNESAQNNPCTASNSKTDQHIVSPLETSLSSNAAHSTTSVTSSSKNTIVIASATSRPTKPTTSIQSNTSIFVGNQQHNQTPSAYRVIKIVDCKPGGPHIVETPLNKNTSIPFKTQPSLQGKTHLGAIVKTSSGQKVLLVQNKNLGKFNNPSLPLLRTGFVDNQLRDNLPGSNLVHVRTTQNLNVIKSHLKPQSSMVDPHQVLSVSNTVQSVSSLNSLVGQSSCQEFSSISRSPQPTAILVGNRSNQAIKTAPTSIQEPPQSEQKTKTLLVCDSSPSGQSKDLKSRNTLPIVLKPSLDGSKTGAPCGNLYLVPTSFMSQAPCRPTQSTKICKLNTIRTLPDSASPRFQANQVSNGNAHGAEPNKSSTPQRMIIITKSQNITPPAKVITVQSSEYAQGSKIGDVNAVKSAITKQYLNQTVPIEKTLYSDAMIYYPSEASYSDGVPIRKYSLIPRNMNSSQVVEPRLTTFQRPNQWNP